MSDGIFAEAAVAPLDERMRAYVEEHFEQKVSDILDQPSVPDDTILHRLTELYRREMWESTITAFGKELDEKFTVPEHGGEPGKFESKAVRPLMKWMIDRLIANKDKFKYIFRTGKSGSIYFVLPTGESVRFKRKSSHMAGSLLHGERRVNDGKPEEFTYDRNIRVQKCFFIPQSEAGKLMEQYRTGKYDLPLQTVPMREGELPFELGTPGFLGYQDILPDSDGVLDLAKVNNFTAFHVGSSVSEVLYSN